MQEVNLSNANQAYLNNKKSVNVTAPSVEPKKQIEDGDKKIKLALGALAAVGVAIAAGVQIYRHKNASKVLDEGKEQATKLLNGLDSKARKELFENIKTDKFTGIVQDTLKNGDKVTLEYADGVLKKSSRSGSTTFEKVYETLENGTHKVITTKDAKSSSVVLEDLQDAALDSQTKLKILLNKKDNLTIEEFQKQADEIKFKSKKQQEGIEQVIQDKQKAAIEKAKAERLEFLSKYKQIDVSDPNNEQIHIFCKKLTDEYPAAKNLGEEELKLVTKNKGLTLDSKDNLFTDFETATIYDVPEKMAIAADNSLRSKGNAYICDNVPEMFKGMDNDEVCSSISSFLNNASGEKYSRFTIAGKEFYAERLNGGCVGTVYKITDEKGAAVAIKKYKNPRMLGTNCGFQEIATLRQANLEDVVNVPKFYMANASGYKPLEQSKEYLQDSMWMMTDFIQDGQKAPETGKTLMEWMKKYNLHHYDMNQGTMIGDYFVDMGGIMPSATSASVKNMENWGNGFSDYFMSSLQDEGYEKLSKHYAKA